MELLADPAVRDAGYAVGRTSHTGGHRFAPTAIVLPQGTMWAHLDRGTVARILRRTGPVADVLALYRGSTGIGSPELQALERHAFAEIGWGWLDWRREGREVADGVVALSGDAPTGERAAWEAVVTSRARPVPGLRQAAGRGAQGVARAGDRRLAPHRMRIGRRARA